MCRCDSQSHMHLMRRLDGLRFATAADAVDALFLTGETGAAMRMLSQPKHSLNHSLKGQSGSGEAT